MGFTPRKTILPDGNPKGVPSGRRNFQHDLEGMMEHIQNPKLLKEHAKTLHQAHASSSSKEDTAPADASNVPNFAR